MRSVAFAFDAPIFEQLHVRGPPPQRNTYCERTGEHGWILDRGLVFQRVLGRQPKSLDDMSYGSPKIAGLVQPALPVQSTHLDHERIAVPVPSRIAIPCGIILEERTAVGRNDAHAVLR